MSGSNTTGQIGIYGTKMVESTTNIPGAREDSASWIDANGNFWLFGGDGYDKNGNTGYLNDFWKYNPLTNTWTWMSGNGVVNMQTLYGTQGTFSPSNSIGGREDSAVWADNNGNFWLFGGNGYGVQPWPSQGYLNDMWLINIQ
jgi:N-acetylneuraminic acid mutarotase